LELFEGLWFILVVIFKECIFQSRKEIWGMRFFRRLTLIVWLFSLTSFLWYFQIYFGVDLLIVKACGIFISVRKIIKKQFFIRLYFDQRVWEVIETIKGKYGGMQEIFAIRFLVDNGFLPIFFHLHIFLSAF